uniref:RNA helicase n=1 Tax=viral metagenome TaxID=1070528 RepID=A0A6C0B7Y9_9ZZZZ
MGSTWDSLGLKTNLLRGIYSVGFESPSQIQAQSIPVILSGKDVIAQAQSGTGKTGAFCISTLQKCTNDPTLQSIILAPTRELSSQIHSVFESLSIHTGIFGQLLIGGVSIDKDIKKMQQHTSQVLIGCPGRVLDFLNRKVVSSASIHLIVLDEADEILSQGFQSQLYNIFQYLTDAVQVVMFSATIKEELHEISNKIMRDPVKLLVKSEMLTLEGIAQFYISFQNDQDKIEALKDLYNFISMSQSIIYCNSVKRVVDLYHVMKSSGFPVCCIHSDMDKQDRHNAYQEFKSGKYRVLISSNVTARGIDIQQVSTVINFDLPKCVDTYLHRIGRSGRWGRKGVGINFITNYDTDKMKEIETHYGTQIKEFPSTYTTLLT